MRSLRVRPASMQMCAMRVMMIPAQQQMTQRSLLIEKMKNIVMCAGEKVRIPLHCIQMMRQE